MKPRSIFPIVLLCLCASLLAGCEDFIGWLKDDPVVLAKSRVKNVLSGLTRGSTVPIGIVTHQWYGSGILEDSSSTDVIQRFEAWCRQRGLEHRGVESWKITDARELESAKTFTVIVSGEINGKKFEMIVPENQPIRWKRSRR